MPWSRVRAPPARQKRLQFPTLRVQGTLRSVTKAVRLRQEVVPIHASYLAVQCPPPSAKRGEGQLAMAEKRESDRRDFEVMYLAEDDNGEYKFSIEDICDQLGISKQTVQNWRRELALPSRRAQYTPRTRDDEIQELRGEVAEIKRLLYELLQRDSKDDPEPGNSTEVLDGT